ncbi:hypothetical protein ACFODO_16455 [Acinetobacter sichuanensis]|uniref:PIN domain-containing protein n=1 Tax=Acinetobacter sichuanensis TaxID=2136183 RepID=A0A371YIX3_9GAMM|nr:hypothetical protein [Acinetobacter sichuanensis]RFC81380.1 hypothetical protein C9E89_022200 [Acinetobacter sichuanensis]
MDNLIKKMQRNGVLIDTNILILLIIGLTDERSIAKHKKLSAYSIEDFRLLVAILDSCKHIIASPHILAETSNLASRGLYGDMERRVFYALKQVFSEQKFIEIHTNAVNVSNNEGYLKYGLSDVGLLETLKGEYVLLTDDFVLSGYAEKFKYDVLNFNHLRNGIFDAMK